MRDCRSRDHLGDCRTAFAKGAFVLVAIGEPKFRSEMAYRGVLKERSGCSMGCCTDFSFSLLPVCCLTDIVPLPATAWCDVGSACGQVLTVRAQAAGLAQP